MSDLEKLAIIIDKVADIESEIESRAQELMELVGAEDFTKEQKELFAPIFDALDNALGEAQTCLRDFRVTFEKVAIGQKFVITRYWTWTKISETRASGVFIQGNHTDEMEFNANTLVYVIPSDGGACDVVG